MSESLPDRLRSAVQHVMAPVSEEDIEAVDRITEEAADEIERLTAENQKLTDGLLPYADRNNWECTADCEACCQEYTIGIHAVTEPHIYDQWQGPYPPWETAKKALESEVSDE